MRAWGELGGPATELDAEAAMVAMVAMVAMAAAAMRRISLERGWAMKDTLFLRSRTSSGGYGVLAADPIDHLNNRWSGWLGV